MILPARSLPEGAVSARRPIIVGSGPVGLTLARYLASHGRSSLVLEGGAESPTSLTDVDLAVDAQGFPLYGAAKARTRQVGGGLNLWGGQLANLTVRESEPTGDAPTGWPIALHEILDRKGVAATLLGHSATSSDPIAVVGGLEREVLAASEFDLIATTWIKQPKLGGNIWSDLRRSRLITIAHDAFVDRIEVDSASGEAVGISTVSADGSRLSFRGSCVILACGAIETTRLLLQPCSDGSPQSWSRLYWLGRGFNEHLDATVARVTPLDARRLLNVFDPILLDSEKYTLKVFSQFKADDRSPLSAVATLTMPGNLRNSIAELRMLLRGLTPRDICGRYGQIVAASVASAREIGPLAWRYMRHKRLGSVFRGAATLRVSIEQPVRAESRITLSSYARDSRGIPLARVHWVKGEEEGRVFFGMARKVKQWSESANLAQVEIDPLLLDDPAGFAAKADDGLHHAGGTRMAAEPLHGVVNTNLQVFGTPGLYCCGSSTFPRSGFANPTLTAVALGIRLGDHLISTGRAAA